VYLATLGVDPSLTASEEQKRGRKWVGSGEDLLSAKEIIEMEVGIMMM
jgi:hypothetical protein